MAIALTNENFFEEPTAAMLRLVRATPAPAPRPGTANPRLGLAICAAVTSAFWAPVIGLFLL